MTSEPNPIAHYIASLAKEPEARGAALYAAGVEHTAEFLEKCANDPVWAAAARRLPADQIVLHLAGYIRAARVWPDRDVSAAMREAVVPSVRAPAVHSRLPWHAGGFANVVMRGFFHRNSRSTAAGEAVGGPR